MKPNEEHAKICALEDELEAFFAEAGGRVDVVTRDQEGRAVIVFVEGSRAIVGTEEAEELHRRWEALLEGGRRAGSMTVLQELLAEVGIKVEI